MIRPQQTTDECQNTFQHLGSIAIETAITNQNAQQTEGLQFGLSSEDFFLLPSSSQGAQTWSPMGLAHEEFSSSLPSMLESSSQSNPWSPTMDTQRGLLRSTTPSFSESSPLLSQSMGHRRCMTDSDRSSYGSSLRTWDTASTLVSCDMYGDDIKVSDFNAETTQSIDPSQLAKKPPPVSSFDPQSTVIEEKLDSSNCAQLARAYDKALLPPNSKTPSESETTANSQKGQEKYICTSCKRGFIRKGDWKRHEESHDPQKYWICLLGEPAIQSMSTTMSTSGWTCVFCTTTKATRNEMISHLVDKHKISVCTNKRIEARTFYRKDKLKQHLQQVHHLAETCSPVWETWHQAARKKWAWGCGYCGGCSFTWEGTFLFLTGHISSTLGHSVISFYYPGSSSTVLDLRNANGGDTVPERYTLSRAYVMRRQPHTLPTIRARNHFPSKIHALHADPNPPKPELTSVNETGRLIHIAEHYEKQHPGMSRWSQSLVVKGLLKQIYRDFNVDSAWKELMSRDANGDRLLAWTRKNASRLQNKLQFHEGAATDVAAEAQRLAQNRSPMFTEPAWRPSDSRVATLMSPAMIEFGLQTWAEESGDPSQSQTYTTSIPQPDVEMPDSEHGYI